MKVLLFNGSMHKNGTTYAALSKVAESLNEEGIETEILHIGSAPVRDCVACGGCQKTGKCVFADDIVNEWAEKAEKADGFVFGSPVYYSHPSGRIMSAMDRLFYSAGKNFTHKPGAVIAAARRAGTTQTLDAMEKHLSIMQMPIVSSTYWNMVFGSNAADAQKDLEGMQSMYNLGKNMAWLIKCIAAGEKAGISSPATVKTRKTNFIS